MGSSIARANALANVQQLRNQYAKESADLLNQMGTSLMNERTRAQMFNEQMNAHAHASQVQQKYMAKRNMLDYATQFAKNAWERNQFDRMMDLYWQQLATDRMKAGIGVTETPTIGSVRRSAAGQLENAKESISKSAQKLPKTTWWGGVFGTEKDKARILDDIKRKAQFHLGNTNVNPIESA